MEIEVFLISKALCTIEPLGLLFQLNQPEKKKNHLIKDGIWLPKPTLIKKEEVGKHLSYLLQGPQGVHHGLDLLLVVEPNEFVHHSSNEASPALFEE